jgi:hypothetical protein
MSTDESGREDFWENRKRARTRHEAANRLKRCSFSPRITLAFR